MKRGLRPSEPDEGSSTQHPPLATQHSALSTQHSALLQRFPLLIHLSLLLTAVFWGVTFVAVKYVNDETGPEVVLLMRSWAAALCFVVLLALAWRSVPRMPASVWRRLAVIGFFGSVINTVAIAVGQSYLAAALASLIVTSNPIFTAIFSRILLGEPLTRRKLTGIAIAFTGFVIVLLWGGSNASFSVDNATGILILICAPLAWALYTVLSKPLLADYEPHIVAGLTTILGAIMLAPVFVAYPNAFADAAGLDWRGWLASGTMSILAIFVGYTLWYRGLRRLQPSQVAVYVYLVPFFGVLSAWLLLGETITGWLLLGGATILTGVIVTNSGRRPPAEPLPADAQPRVS